MNDEQYGFCLIFN